MMLLAVGEDPASLDIDLTKMFGVPLEIDPTAAQMGGRTIAYVSGSMDRARVREFFPKIGWLQKMGLAEPSGFREFNRVADVFVQHTRGAVEATHEEYFRYVPASLRDRIRAISLEHWPEVDRVEYVTDTRCDSLADQITETL